MKSLRELVDDLTTFRLDANDDIPQWETYAAVTEYARRALNDALAEFVVEAEVTAHSFARSGDYLILPKMARRVVDVVPVGSTMGRRITHYEHMPTSHTNLLRVHARSFGHLRVTYTRAQPLLPPDTTVAVDSVSVVRVSGASPTFSWPAGPSFVEMYLDTGGYELREVIVYDSLGHDDLGVTLRGFEGHEIVWPAGATVSHCYFGDDQALRPIQLMAQAVMYEFFLRDRALYDRYTGQASQQALSIEQMQDLIFNMEARAHAAWERYIGTQPAFKPVPGRLTEPIPE